MKEKKALLAKRKKLVLSPESALDTGSALLNLACTGNPDCGFVRGGYYFLVGDSTSGKTWLSLTCFAEACRNKHFRKHRLVFDDVEGGALMDIERFFGREVFERMETESSATVEDFYRTMRRLIKEGQPFIYVLDSQDALDSEGAATKFDKRAAAAEAGQKAKGSYGVDKPKIHSENIKWVIRGLRRTGSILIIIGQTRDNLNPFSFEKKTRSGGKSLKFYANIEIWTSVGKQIKKNAMGKKRTVGVRCLVEVRKNRVTGKIGRDRMVEMPIYNDYGIDDTGSCVDYLVTEGCWKVKKVEGRKFIFARELDFEGTRGELIRHVEQGGFEGQLREAVSAHWKAIEDACRLEGRKKRYP
jgi:RecA/RadA recombinase